jgi:tRNA-dihydrouridine synthase B
MVVRAVDVPVTLKIRTGWSSEVKTALQVAKMAEDAGIAALALHGRTREDMYRGDAEYDTIAAVKRAVAIPVIANGDIDSPEKAKQVLDATGADAIMIGRAAQGRRGFSARSSTSWIPARRAAAAAHQRDRHHAGPPRRAVPFYGEYPAAASRAHIAWYTAACVAATNSVRRCMRWTSAAAPGSGTVFLRNAGASSERLGTCPPDRTRTRTRQRVRAIKQQYEAANHEQQ